MGDIVVTWPQSKSLEDYLAELEEAKGEGLLINYRVARLPKELPQRCFMVHSGFIRGWCPVLYMGWHNSGQVKDWPKGYYIVRSPDWHEIEPVKMKGFRGWRWLKENLPICEIAEGAS